MTKRVNHAGAAVYSASMYGLKSSSWQNPPTAPTPSHLSKSENLFVRLMRRIEKAENKNTIEALRLPSDYTGRTVHLKRFDDKIFRETEWTETLHELLDQLEQEVVTPYVDRYVSGLFTYNFVETETLKGYGRRNIREYHHHDQEQKKHKETDRRFRTVPEN